MSFISLIGFRQGVPIVAISKDGNSVFGDDNIRDTNSEQTLMRFKTYIQSSQSILEHYLNSGISMRLWLLCHSFSSYFVSHFFAIFTMFARFFNLGLSFRCPDPMLICLTDFSSPLKIKGFMFTINTMALMRAKLLGTPTSMSNILATLETLISGRFTPPRKEIALFRAILTPATITIKLNTTIQTNFHYLYYTINELSEQYCKLIVERNRQEVLL